MTQVSTVSRITVVLDITTAGRIRKTITETKCLHNVRLSQVLRSLLSLEQVLGTTLSRPSHGNERVRLHAENVLDCLASVETSCHGAAGGLDGGNGGCGGARNDQVNWLFQGGLVATEDLDAFFRLVDAA